MFEPLYVILTPSVADSASASTTLSNVPFWVRALVMVDPSNAVDDLATLFESDASVMTSLSPFAMATSVVCRAPPDVMLPCVWVDFEYAYHEPQVPLMHSRRYTLWSVVYTV